MNTNESIDKLQEFQLSELEARLEMVSMGNINSGLVISCGICIPSHPYDRCQND